MIFIFTTPDVHGENKTQSNLKTGVVFIDISKSLDISVTRISILSYVNTPMCLVFNKMIFNKKKTRLPTL